MCHDSDPESVIQAVLILLALSWSPEFFSVIPPALFAGTSAPLRSLSILHPNRMERHGFIVPMKDCIAITSNNYRERSRQLS